MTQQEMAEALGIDQTKYSKYEIRTPLPHRHIVQFCSLCEVTMAWLYTAAIPIAARKPKKRRSRRPSKAA